MGRDYYTFTFYVGDVHGYGVSASFEKCEREDIFYKLRGMNDHNNEGSEAIDFETPDELQQRFIELMTYADEVIQKNSPEPTPPGRSVQVAMLEAA